MKKFLFFIVSTSLMSGCAVSYDPSTSSKSTPVDFPPLGQVNTAYVGDSMMSKGILVEGEAIVLKNAIDGVAYDIPSGTYDKLGSNNTADVFKTVTREGQIVIQNPFADPYQALGVKKNNPNELCVITVFGMYSCYAANFEVKKVSSINSASFQQTLIYSGKVGNKINIGYRETSNDIARPAFNNDVEYDLGESQEIGYKGAVVEVISADNQKITYRVVKSFR